MARGGRYDIILRGGGDILTAKLYNEDHLRHVENAYPEQFDDFSDNLDMFRTVFNPYEGNVPQLPVSLAQEIAALRYMIGRITGEGDWYLPPASNLKTGGGGGRIRYAIVSYGTVVDLTAGFAVLPNWDEEEIDIGDWFDTRAPDRFTIPAGIHRVRMHAFVSVTGIESGQGATFSVRHGKVGVDGLTTVVAAQGVEIDGTTVFTLSTPVVEVAETDYFQLWGSLTAAVADGTDPEISIDTKFSIFEFRSSEGEIPSGGETGQALLKKSDDDFDLEWGVVVGLLPDGGSTSQFLVKESDDDYDATWVDLPFSFIPPPNLYIVLRVTEVTVARNIKSSLLWRIVEDASGTWYDTDVNPDPTSVRLGSVRVPDGTDRVMVSTTVTFTDVPDGGVLTVQIVTDADGGTPTTVVAEAQGVASGNMVGATVTIPGINVVEGQRFGVHNAFEGDRGGNTFLEPDTVFTVRAVGKTGLTFLGLLDTPDFYDGHAGKAVVVNADEDGVEFGNAPSGGGSAGTAGFRAHAVLTTPSDVTTDVSIPASGTNPAIYTLLDAHEFAGPINKDLDFFTEWEGSITLEMSSACRAVVSMHTTHAFGTGFAKTFTHTRSFSADAPGGTRVSVPLGVFDSVSRIPVGTFQSTTIAEADLALPSKITYQLEIQSFARKGTARNARALSFLSFNSIDVISYQIGAGNTTSSSGGASAFNELTGQIQAAQIPDTILVNRMFVDDQIDKEKFTTSVRASLAKADAALASADAVMLVNALPTVLPDANTVLILRDPVDDNDEGIYVVKEATGDYYEGYVRPSLDSVIALQAFLDHNPNGSVGEIEWTVNGLHLYMEFASDAFSSTPPANLYLEAINVDADGDTIDASNLLSNTDKTNSRVVLVRQAVYDRGGHYSYGNRLSGATLVFWGGVDDGARIRFKVYTDSGYSTELVSAAGKYYDLITDNKFPHQFVLSRLEQAGATDGQVMTWSDSANKWGPGTVTSSGETSTVPTVLAGTRLPQPTDGKDGDFWVAGLDNGRTLSISENVEGAWVEIGRATDRDDAVEILQHLTRDIHIGKITSEWSNVADSDADMFWTVPINNAITLTDANFNNKGASVTIPASTSPRTNYVFVRVTASTDVTPFRLWQDGHYSTANVWARAEDEGVTIPTGDTYHYWMAVINLNETAQETWQLQERKAIEHTVFEGELGGDALTTARNDSRFEALEHLTRDLHVNEPVPEWSDAADSEGDVYQVIDPGSAVTLTDANFNNNGSGIQIPDGQNADTLIYVRLPVAADHTLYRITFDDREPRAGHTWRKVTGPDTSTYQYWYVYSVNNFGFSFVQLEKHAKIESTTYTGDGAVPVGGTTGQALTKKSGDDYDTEWTTVSGGGGGTDATARNAAAAAQATADAALPKSGGTMTGKITLDGAPTANLHPATKAYADTISRVALRALPLAGGTMTGTLTLAGEPTADLQAATKAYVDKNAGSGSSSSGGGNSGSGTPTTLYEDGSAHTWDHDGFRSITLDRAPGVGTVLQFNLKSAPNGLMANTIYMSSDAFLALEVPDPSATGYNVGWPSPGNKAWIGVAPAAVDAAARITYSIGGNEWSHLTFLFVRRKSDTEMDVLYTFDGVDRSAILKIEELPSGGVAGGGESSGGGGGGLTPVGEWQRTTTMERHDAYATGITIPDDADWLLVNVGEWFTNEAHGQWVWIRAVDIKGRAPIAATEHFTDTNGIRLYHNSNSETDHAFIGHSTDNEIMFGYDSAGYHADKFQVFRFDSGGGGAAANTDPSPFELELIGESSMLALTADTVADTGLDMPASVASGEVWAIKIGNERYDDLSFFFPSEITGGNGAEIGDTLDPNTNAGDNAGVTIRAKRGNSTQSDTILLAQDSTGNIVISSSHSNLDPIVTLYRVRGGSGSQLSDRDDLPPVDNYSVNDLVAVEDDFYKLAVTDASVANLFTGEVGRDVFNNTAGERWRGISNSQSPNGFSTDGEFTANPSNTLSLLLASSQRHIRVAMKLSVYEAAKGSAFNTRDHIAIKVTMADGTTTDEAVLAYYNQYERSEHYVIWQHRHETDNYNLYNEDAGNAIKIEFFTTRGSTPAATKTPLFTHDAAMKHWIHWPTGEDPTEDGRTALSLAQANSARIDALDMHVDGISEPIHSQTYDENTALRAPTAGNAGDFAISQVFNNILTDDLIVIDWKKCEHLNHHDEYVVPGSDTDSGRMYLHPRNFDNTEWNGEFVYAVDRAIQNNGSADTLNSWIVGSILYSGSTLTFGLHLQQGGSRANRNLKPQAGFSLTLRIYRNTIRALPTSSPFKGIELGRLVGHNSNRLGEQSWTNLATDVTTVDGPGSGWSHWLSIPMHNFITLDGGLGLILEMTRTGVTGQFSQIFIPWHMMGNWGSDANGPQLFGGLWQPSGTANNDRIEVRGRINNGRLDIQAACASADTTGTLHAYIAR